MLFLIYMWAIFWCGAASAMTEAQLKATTKLIRNACQPKTRATNDVIDGMYEGNWDLDRDGMCYLHCVLGFLKLITKDNAFDEQSATAQVKTLPIPLQDISTQCMEKCRDAIVTKDDGCKASWELCKCLYDCNPGAYFLP